MLLAQAFGVLRPSVYNESAARKRSLGDRASTAAEVRDSPNNKLFVVRHSRRFFNGVGARQCLTLVQSKFPDANAAEFSNTAGEGCAAVYDACASFLLLTSYRRIS